MRRLVGEKKYRGLFGEEGYRNTRFFHKKANAHRCHNHINKMSFNGEVREEVKEIEKSIVDL